MIELAGVTFNLPQYYGAPDDNGWYQIDGDESGCLFFKFEDNVPFTESLFRNQCGQIVEGLETELTEGGNTVSKPVITETEIASGIPAAKFTMGVTVSGTPMSVEGMLFSNVSKGATGVLFIVQGSNSPYDYSPDFQKVISSAHVEQVAEEPAAAPASPEGVSPDLKEMLDSYEAFMDEYVSFMQKYQDSNDMVGMMADYSNYMQRYLEFTQKVESLDTSNMSTADYAYYIEVTARVSQKLLETM